MTVHYFHSPSVSFAPDEADTPLIVNANAVLSIAISRESLKAISRRHSPVIQVPCAVQDRQFSLCPPLHVFGKFADPPSFCDRLSVSVTKTSDHKSMSRPVDYWLQHNPSSNPVYPKAKNVCRGSSQRVTMQHNDLRRWKKETSCLVHPVSQYVPYREGWGCVRFFGEGTHGWVCPGLIHGIAVIRATGPRRPAGMEFWLWATEPRHLPHRDACPLSRPRQCRSCRQCRLPAAVGGEAPGRVPKGLRTALGGPSPRYADGHGGWRPRTGQAEIPKRLVTPLQSWLSPVRPWFPAWIT